MCSSVLRTGWSGDPFARGAYSFWTPGYMQRYGGVEATPVGAIHFAGEHTSASFQGYIEGGAEQGIRAAREIIAAY